jgi:hypothetical protein
MSMRRGPGRPPKKQKGRVLSAVKRLQRAGKPVSGPTIAKAARVPLKHVHPLLNRARAAGEVFGTVTRGFTFPKEA